MENVSAKRGYSEGPAFIAAIILLIIFREVFSWLLSFYFSTETSRDLSFIAWFLALINLCYFFGYENNPLRNLIKRYCDNRFVVWAIYNITAFFAAWGAGIVFIWLIRSFFGFFPAADSGILSSVLLMFIVSLFIFGSIYLAVRLGKKNNT